MVHFRGFQEAVKYGLRRIDYVNPANKLVSKFAPPGYRKGLFKLVKASELFIGGKTAYDIYVFMTAEDSPGNAVQTPYVKRPKTYQPDKARGRYSVRKYSRYCRPSDTYQSRRRSRSR